MRINFYVNLDMLNFSRLGKVGRLGNQLFQVAFITHFAQKFGIKYQIPYWKYSEYFDYKFNFTTNDLLETQFDLVLREPGLGYYENYFTNYLTEINSKNVDIVTGYFQSYKYFSKQHTLKIFRPNNKFKPIKTDPSKGMAISVRRGDFVNHQHYNNIEADKFRELLQDFKQKKVFVFTDDYKYCRNEFIGPQYEFMEGLNDIEQLISLSQFEYFILSNSTFSYWGPMLNPNPQKVLYPYYMFPDQQRCNVYNEVYWPQETSVYIPYKNAINKGIQGNNL